MSLRAFFGALFGAVSDVLGGPLRGLALLAALLAIPLLAAATAGAILFLVPLIPLIHGAPVWITDALKLVAGVGAVAIAFLLWPAVSMLIGGAMFDVAAERVEKTRFPADAPGKPPRFSEGLAHALRTALPTLALNLLALPLLFIPGVNVIAFLTLNGFLISRDFFTLAALRFRSGEEVRALRKRHGGALLLAGLCCAVLLYFPLLNFLAPLYGAAVMVRMNKAMATAPA